MCGISGFYAFTSKGKQCQSKLKESIDTLNKRGPDYQVTFFHNNIGLAHARLSIIDTSDNAKQPFIDNTGRYVICFNGEIFNFKEIKKSLLEKSYTFKTESDTEVLLYLLIEEGIDSVKKLNGFFAISFYDMQTQTLYLIRDRYGVKPLVYYKNDDVIAFASETKAIKAFDLPLSLNNNALYNYLQFNYIPNNDSIYNQIQKIPPGSYLKVKDKTITSERYYQINIPESTSSNKQLDYEKSKNEFKNLLQNAVQRRLIADVPLGAFLSGGIDSSVIVALASEYVSDLKTFSIGYKDEPLFDETRYAELVAEKYKTNHTTFKLTNDDLLKILFDFLDYIDEPYADSSALAVYILSQQTKKHVTVALSGDGADEILAGYNKHGAEYKIVNSNAGKNIASIAYPFVKKLSGSRNSAFGNKIRQIKKFAEGAKLSTAERYWLWCSITPEKDVNKLIKFKIDKEKYLLDKANMLHNFTNTNDFNEVLKSDMEIVLYGDMLTKVDLASMANSLEIRNPFLDYTFVDFAFSLPSSYKINGNERKKILLDTFKSYLPEQIYTRPKHGFEVPLLKWFKNELNSFIENEILNEEFIKTQGIFNWEEIKQLKKQLYSIQPGDVAAKIWAIIVFQYWYKKNIKNFK